MRACSPGGPFTGRFDSLVTGDPKLFLTELEMDRARLTAKREIRSRMRALRGAVPEGARARRSRLVCARVVQLPCFERAGSIVAYMAIDNEVDPSGVLDRASREGKATGLPRVDLENNTLSLHRWSPGDPLRKGALGVREPLAAAPLLADSDAMLILVPAVAIDPAGYRIGYGKGFYDRFLEAHPDLMTVGIVYDFQLISESPGTPGDVPVSGVVTDKRTLFSGSDG